MFQGMPVACLGKFFFESPQRAPAVPHSEFSGMLTAGFQGTHGIFPGNGRKGNPQQSSGRVQGKSI